ncbi:hypothetical protein QQ045_023354 [Rhodiola kirilowii]
MDELKEIFLTFVHTYYMVFLLSFSPPSLLERVPQATLQNNLLSNPYHHHSLRYTGARLPRLPRQLRVARAFQRSDFDSFARRVSSGEAWKDAWRTANDKFEYEARKTAERIE